MTGLVWRCIVTALVAYFLGNLNGAIILSSLLEKDDVRTHGSGNAGLTNYVRSYGYSRTGLVILIDMGKTVLACFTGGLLLESSGYYLEGVALAGLFVSLGHDLPVFQGFRGGKGILCGWAIAMVADWRVGLAVIVLFALCVLLTRYVSLGSCLAALGVGVGMTLSCPGQIWVLVPLWLTVFLALFMHRGNIKRLLQGNERKISFHHKEEKQ